MCGIAGCWHSRATRSLSDTVRGMTDAIAHRGPDADGLWVDEDAGLALGHRRLSIVDLTPSGAQPMLSARGRWAVSFNGEIYNFRELRDRLSAAGVQWRGTSDTEVLLEAVECWGLEAALTAFAGMYAFALWDRQERVLHLVRDRLGEKPLYAGVSGSSFLFGSELKALRAHPDAPGTIRPDAVVSLLRHGYIAGPGSIYTEIERIAPGGHVEVRATASGFDIRKRRYWSVSTAIQQPATSYGTMDEATDEFERLLAAVISDEMVADVPVGAFLSGGIDSSLIVATMQRVASRPVKTFTVAFDDAAFDESPYALAVAQHLGTDHTELRLSTGDALGMVTDLPRYYDEPFADSSQLPTLLVSRETRKHVTVALSGDAGDELFGGYSQYLLADTIGTLTARVPAAGRAAMRALVAAAPSGLIELALRGRDTWSENARARVVSGLSGSDERTQYEELVSRWVDPLWAMSRDARRTLARPEADTRPVWPRTSSAASSRMAYDLQTYLPDDIMVKVDRAAMAASLESRAPLLHHAIVEFALRVPLEYKIRGSEGKLLLRHALARHVPKALFERPKRGFAIPLDSWLRNELRPWAEAQLERDARMSEWFDGPRVARVWREHLSGAENHGMRLWPILVFAQWLRAMHH
ncbi:MAG: asparagine synthase (glutamine-hydrolyzing) [Gemmatimonadota bacterium]